MKHISEKKLKWAAIIFIIFLGAFLRFYHFSDWLHFELDQARDARVIAWAIENGPSNLPLLGPRAAGSYLRLGPIFYYFEYLGARIFGNTPPGIASFILIFSTLTVPLVYFFLKRYFSFKRSLELTAIFSVSLFFVLYSRFAWNPNMLPFFILLFLWGLLKAVDKKEKRRSLWLVISFIALAIATQLHFLAFITLPIVAFFFLIWKRPRLKISAWLLAIASIFILYSPMIINEFMTRGDNTAEFLNVVSKKSDKNTHNIIEKGIRNYSEQSVAYLLMLSGREKAELPKVEISNLKSSLFDLKCDYSCRQNWPLGIFSLVLFSGGISLLFFRIRSERDEKRRNFLVLSAFLFAISFLVFTPLAYDISPRFYLLIVPLPFIMAGLIFDFLEKRLGRAGKAVVIAFVIILAVSNINLVIKRFNELKKASSQAIEIEPDKILKERERVTLEQQLKISDYISEKFKKNKFPVYLDSEAFYERAFIYHLTAKEIPAQLFGSKQKDIYRNGNYFLIYRTSSNYEDDSAKYAPKYDILEQKTFGTFLVFNIAPKEEFITDKEEKVNAELNRPSSGSKVPKRYMWEEIFSQSEEESED